MAYEPTTWNNDDVITAEKLNKLEQGVKNEQVGQQDQDNQYNQQQPGRITSRTSRSKRRSRSSRTERRQGKSGRTGQCATSYTLPAANKTTLGGVKQMALIEDLSTETTADLKNKINAILAEMKKQGIMANS